MKVRRKYIPILLFLFGMILSTYLVFNYTTRTRKPSITYKSNEEINDIGISRSGNSLTIGGKHGEILFFERGKNIPIWSYHNNAKIISVALSEKGDFVASIDNNHNLNLFSNSPYYVDDEISPRWTYNLQEHGAISGIHSSSGIPPLIFIVMTMDDRIILLSNRDGVVWEYQTEGSKVMALVSSDGRKIVAADSKGEAYVFNINSANPIWSKSTGLTDLSLSFSQDSTIVVGGRTEEGKGEVQILSMKDGVKIWDWNSEKPINSVSISSDGTQVLTYQESGEIYIIQNKIERIEERVIDIPGSVNSITTPHFGSYAAVLNSEGTLYFYYTPRKTPLWRYDTDIEATDIEISSTGDKVFLATQNEVDVIFNVFQSGFIPGSRILWGVVFLTGVIGTLHFSNISLESLEWLINDRKYRSKIVLCVILNGFIGLGYRNFNLMILGIISCIIAGIFAWKREGFLGFVTGFFVTMIVSILTGLMIGLFYWFNGVEENIISLTVINLVIGGRRGIIFGIINSLIWFTPIEFLLTIPKKIRAL